MMGVTIYKRGKVWWISVSRDGAQERWSLKTTDRQIAAKAAKVYEQRLASGEKLRQPRPDSPTFAAYSVAWLERKAMSRRKATVDGYRMTVAEVSKVLGAVPVIEVTRIHARAVAEVLRRWGCKQIGWMDDFEAGRIALQFVWHYDGQDFVARFAIQLPTEDELRRAARRAGSWNDAPLLGKLEKLRGARGRVEHRQLLLWLKAAFNAVDAGIIRAEQVFLPWLVTRDGRTVAERALPELSALLARSSGLLLGSGDA